MESIIKLHKDFLLNGIAFVSVKSLLSYASKNEISSGSFLKELFNNKPYIVVKTSGSTGKPKNIKLFKKHLINSAIATGTYFNLKETTTALLCLSPEYIAGKMMLVRAITLGWHLTIIEAKSKPLNGNKKYDFTAMVPLQVQSSINDLHKVGKIIIGGGTVSNELKNKLKGLKTKAYATYGMTETCTHIAIKPLNHLKTNDASFTILPNIKISKDHRDCLVINAPEIANQLIITNDLVKITSKKSFNWLGRFDTIINSGGIKIIPEQVEKKLQKLITFPFFISSEKDEILGEKIILIVENDKIENLESKIKSLDLLSKFEKPKEIFYIKKFIRTKTEKIDRKSTLKLLHL